MAMKCNTKWQGHCVFPSCALCLAQARSPGDSKERPVIPERKTRQALPGPVRHEWYTWLDSSIVAGLTSHLGELYAGDTRVSEIYTYSMGRQGDKALGTGLPSRKRQKIKQGGQGVVNRW